MIQVLVMEICKLAKCFTSKVLILIEYRVTEQLVQNLPLNSNQKFRFGLARPGQARPKRNFCFEVNGRF